MGERETGKLRQEPIAANGASEAPCSLVSDAPEDRGGATDEQLWRRRFDYWMECEKVAMHFNDLLSGLRLKAIGGLALAGAVLGTLAEKAEFSLEAYKAIASGLLVLAALWIAVAALDLFYYSDLLRGAVDELERLESAPQLQVRLSSAIETRVVLGERFTWQGGPEATQMKRKRSQEMRPRYVYAVFYLLPLFAICALIAVCFYQAGALVLAYAVPSSVFLPVSAAVCVTRARKR